jgi:toxin HigB-1
MIRTFGDALTEDLFHGSYNSRTKRISPLLLSSILRKLDMLNSAITINDLRMPPGNRLEALKGDLNGYYSIRVNDQFRIIFTWSEPYADTVKLVDYH